MYFQTELIVAVLMVAAELDTRRNYAFYLLHTAVYPRLADVNNGAAGYWRGQLRVLATSSFSQIGRAYRQLGSPQALEPFSFRRSGSTGTGLSSSSRLHLLAWRMGSCPARWRVTSVELLIPWLPNNPITLLFQLPLYLSPPTRRLKLRRSPDRAWNLTPQLRRAFFS